MKNRLTVLGSPRPAKTRRCRHFLNCVNPTFDAFTGLSHPEQLFITALFLQHVDDQGVLSLQRIYWDGGTRLNNLHKSRIEQKDVHQFGPTNSIKLGRKWAPLSLFLMVWWAWNPGILSQNGRTRSREPMGHQTQWRVPITMAHHGQECVYTIAYVPCLSMSTYMYHPIMSFW